MGDAADDAYRRAEQELEDGDAYVIDDITEQVIMFRLSAADLELAEEITLAGVIAGKFAKGDYVRDPNWGQLQSAYESCSKVNGKLHAKLNRVRKALGDDQEDE